MRRPLARGTAIAAPRVEGPWLERPFELAKASGGNTLRVLGLTRDRLTRDRLSPRP